MSKINVRSPYYISTGQTTRLNSQLLELWVYTGRQQTDRPTTPTYSLESFAVGGLVTFEISELVKDYIAQTYSHDAYATEILWVDYQQLPLVALLYAVVLLFWFMSFKTGQQLLFYLLFAEVPLFLL